MQNPNVYDIITVGVCYNRANTGLYGIKYVFADAVRKNNSEDTFTDKYTQRGNIMYTAQQLNEIFRRVGMTYSDDIKPDYALLSELHFAFQSHIPYDNLTILRRIPLSLEPDALYEKIINGHNGGFCFELNGFLSEVLSSLGYTVRNYFARYLRGREEGTIPMRRHRVLGVNCPGEDKIYLCDVGCGQSAFRIPIEMTVGAVSEQYGESYTVKYDDFYGYIVYDLHKGQWREHYSFTPELNTNDDFLMACRWCENDPESPFNKKISFCIKTLTGRITLDDRTFRIFDGDNVEEKILDDSELKEYSLRYFGLALD